MTEKPEFQSLGQVPLLPTKTNKAVVAPCAGDSSTRAWVRARWGRAKLQLPCRGSGKASGGGGHGSFVHTAVWMQLEPFPVPRRLSCGRRWGAAAGIAWVRKPLTVSWQARAGMIAEP